MLLKVKLVTAKRISISQEAKEGKQAIAKQTERKHIIAEIQCINTEPIQKETTPFSTTRSIREKKRKENKALSVFYPKKLDNAAAENIN